MSATAVFRSPGTAGYGRHAAPLSAYGPSDVGRLLPVPPIRSRTVERADSGDAPVTVVDDAVRSEDVAGGGVDAGDRSSDEASMKTTGFWARLRLLPKSA